MRISDWSSDVCSSDLLQRASAMQGPITRYSAPKPSVVYPLSPDSSASRRPGSRVRIPPPWDLRRHVLWHVFAGWQGSVGPGVGGHAVLRLLFAVRLVREHSPADEPYHG